MRAWRGILSVGDGRADAAPACCLTVGLGVASLVAENGSRCDVRADVEQHHEIVAVAGIAPSEMERRRRGGKSAARAPEGLVFLPPFATVNLRSSRPLSPRRERAARKA